MEKFGQTCSSKSKYNQQQSQQSSLVSQLVEKYFEEGHVQESPGADSLQYTSSQCLGEVVDITGQYGHPDAWMEISG